MLYCENINPALQAAQRLSRCKLALDKNVYCFGISGHGILKEKNSVQKNGRVCLVPVYQWSWPSTTYVFNLMRLQKSF